MSFIIQAAATGNAITANASGSITAGQPCVINTNGTVSQVGLTVQTLTGYTANASTTIGNLGGQTGNDICIDTANDVAIAAFMDASNSNYGTVKYLTVSGTTITASAGTVYISAWADNQRTAYDAFTSKFVTVYRNRALADKYYAIVGSFNGSTFSFGTPVILPSNVANYGGFVTFIPGTGKCILGTRDASGYPTVYVGTVSGTSISWGAACNLNTSGTGDVLSIVWDSNSSNILVGWRKTADFYPTVSTVTISGTTLTLRQEVVLNSTRADALPTVYDPVNAKILAMYNIGVSGPGAAKLITLSGVGNFDSVGSAINFEPTAYGLLNQCAAAYDSVNAKILTVYTPSSSAKSCTFTISGTTVSYLTPITFSASAYWTTVFMASKSTFINSLSYSNTNVYAATSSLTYVYTTNLTATNFIGFASGTVSSGGLATIQTIGGLSTTQAGLTTASQYYVNPNGGISTTAGSPSVYAGLAYAATKLVVKG